MMALNVEDADAWWEHIQKKDLKKKYPGIMCKPPRNAALGTAGALPELSYGRSVAHHREPPSKERLLTYLPAPHIIIEPVGLRADLGFHAEWLRDEP